MAIQLNSNQTYRELTTSQMLIWTGQQLNPGVPLYNMALIYTIEGAIDADLFRQSIQRLVDDCDSLRTVFEGVDGQVRQRVLEKLTAHVELLDFSAEPHPAVALAAWGNHRCRNHFNLATCTFDTALIKLAADRYAWYYNQHHIATDASSFGVIFARVQKIYAALSRGEDLLALPSLPPFLDYISFESESRTDIAASREWFRTKSRLAAPPLYGLPNHNSSTLTRRVTLRLDRETCQRLRSLATQPHVRSLTRHASQFNLIATLLFALLYRISGQRALAIGAPSHNRSTRDFKQSIGLFIEVFPLSVELDKSETFNSLLQKFKTEAMSFLRHARPGASDPKDQRCFNTILNYITATFGEFCGLSMKSQWLHAGACDRGHEMRLQVHDFDDAGDLVFHFDLNVETFDERRQEDLIHHFQTLLDAMLDDLDQPIDAVDLLHEAEKQRLRQHYGPTESGPDSHSKTVVEQFEQQVLNQPEATALICGDEHVTYIELDQRVNAMAAELKSRGVAVGDQVAICLPRSAEAIVSILAALKVRASYVPIDTTYPRQRIEFMLRDAGNPVVMTDTKRRERLPAWSRVLLVEDRVQTLSLGAADKGEGPSPDDTAYTIYTSGSTGHPKGVVITHRNLSHYIGWAREKYVRSRKLSFPLFSPMAFDLTVTSIFLPLVTGGQLIIYPESDSKADLALLDVVEDNLVDMIKLTPSHLALLKGRDLRNSRVRQLILGGEDLRCDVARDAFDAFGQQLEIHNEYGPTEATVGCILHTYDPDFDVRGSVPIGKPIHNMQAYVLNDEHQEVPQGVVGELFIAGAGLAVGYWNRPDLTKERFVDNPFQPGCRMYRTGDLARIRDDGVVEYHGRTDQQVKIRGVRIELGEVESVIAMHPIIDDCVVDLANRSSAKQQDELFQCKRCGLPSNYPNASFDETGTCHLCTAFDSYEEKAQQYFRSMNDLRQLFASAKARNDSPKPSYDCISLLSGGKDSTYMLARLVDMGLHVLAFTLDNGYISDEAKANINRVVETLGVDHTYGSTPAMNEIFVDSLNRHANVCQGCFKTIYTLSMQLAREKRIPFIATGLSRGQFFETRLTEELFTDPNIDAEAIDATILRARKEYHRVNDAVSRLLDVEMFNDDVIFDEVQFVDFYRYCDVELDEMLAYLDQRLPWVRPTDTGRSTNCLINDVGIHVHKLERGYHNYAFPYSWDVRVGHKQRDAAIQELDDEIDETHVNRILEEIGYRPQVQEQRLVAYYVAPAPLTHGELHSHLSAELPDFLIPSHFVHLDAIPLTLNGKVDRNALPAVGEERPELDQDYVAPQTENEAILVQTWQDVLRVERVGIRDNFFDLGGDSIMAIQIIARANKAGLQLTPTQLFDTLTVEKLAAVTGTCNIAAEQGIVTGPVRLTPIQHWFFDQPSRSPVGVSQVFRARTRFVVNDRALLTAFQHVTRQHDALRIAYRRTQNAWVATNLDAECLPDQITQVDMPSSLSDEARNERIQRTIVDMHEQLDITTGQLIKMAKISEQEGSSELLFVAHHLCMDAASWPILIEDLMTAYDQILNEQAVRLPLKASSFQHWSEALSERVTTDEVVKQRDDWLSSLSATAAAIPTDSEEEDPNRQELAVDHVTRLDPELTQRLIEELPAKNRRVHEVLMTSLARTLTAWCGRDRIQLDVEGHGRVPIDPSVDVSRTVGWFTSLYPVSILLSNDSLMYDYDAVRDQLPGQDGLSYGLLRYLSNDGLPVENSRVLFNYLGHANRLLPHDCKLEFTQPLQLYRPSDYIRHHELEINAMVVDERLEVTWTYNRQRHRASTIENLSRSLQSNLAQLVAQLLDPNATSVSAADFPQANLDSEKLHKLSQLLSKVDSVRGRN